jgi:hypothetical protein
VLAFAPNYLTGLASPSLAQEIRYGHFDGMYAENGDACFALTMHP